MTKMLFPENSYTSLWPPLAGLWARPQQYGTAALEWFFYKLALGNILAGNNCLF